MRTVCVLAALVVLASPVVSLAQKAQETAQKVVIDYDKKTDLTKYKTFTWGTGYKALNPAADKAIIAAVEKQLEANGMTKSASGAGDIMVRYHSVERADVDLSTFDQKAPDPGAQRKIAETFRVGTLMVDLVDPRQPEAALAWQGRGRDQP
jgi:hypothetical protein